MLQLSIFSKLVSKLLIFFLHFSDFGLIAYIRKAGNPGNKTPQTSFQFYSLEVIDSYFKDIYFCSIQSDFIMIVNKLKFLCRTVPVKNRFIGFKNCFKT